MATEAWLLPYEQRCVWCAKLLGYWRDNTSTSLPVRYACRDCWNRSGPPGSPPPEEPEKTGET